MNMKIIILIIAVIIIGVISVYFLLPTLFQSTLPQSTGIGEGVFGNANGVSPPSLP
jgi:hypothetical protein